MKPDFKNNELIPAVIQDYQTRRVLMLGYMNEEAYEKTLESGKVTFFSRSKQRLWTKGETSGNYLTLKHMDVDCDNDTLLVQALPAGPTCHTGTDTCFNDGANTMDIPLFLERIIKDRVENPKEGSYTNTLLNNLNKAAQKVGEEAVEMIIESKDQNDNLFLNESADLFYHYLVLLHAKGKEFKDVIRVLEERHKSIG